jgi:hypothetical protein
VWRARYTRSRVNAPETTDHSSGDRASGPSAVIPCAECGWKRGDTLSTTPSWRSPWRLLPGLAVLVFMAVVAALRSETVSRPSSTWSSPTILDEPSVSRVDVQAVAHGTADEGAHARFASALRRIADIDFRFHASALNERSAWVSIGFVRPLTVLREDLLVGWPLTIFWSVRHLPTVDSLSDRAPRATDAPFLHAIPLPSWGGTFRHDRRQVELWYEEPTGRWSAGLSDIRFDSRAPVGAGLGANDVRAAAIFLGGVAFAAAIGWVAWGLTGRVRGLAGSWLRRAAATLFALVVLVATWSTLAEVRRIQSRGWSFAKTPTNGVWEDLRPLGLRRGDIEAMMSTSEGRATIASRILETAPTEGSNEPQYLAVAVGPTWRLDETMTRYPATLPIVTVRERTDESHIPAEIAALPPDTGLTVHWVSEQIEVVWKRAGPASRETVVSIAPGPVLWIMLLAALAGAVPATMVGHWRRRRIRRRERHALCPRCAYPLAPSDGAISPPP